MSLCDYFIIFCFHTNMVSIAAHQQHTHTHTRMWSHIAPQRTTYFVISRYLCQIGMCVNAERERSHARLTTFEQFRFFFLLLFRKRHLRFRTAPIVECTWIDWFWKGGEVAFAPSKSLIEIKQKLCRINRILNARSPITNCR